MRPIRSLTDVLDDAAFISVERQRRLSELLGEGGEFADGWDVDLDMGVMSFTGRAGTLRSPVHVVGTAAPGPGSWLWAWHNVNGFPAPVVERSTLVRDFGARFAIAQFSEAEVPLRGTPHQDAVEYAVAAGLVSGGLPYYTAEVGMGTVLALLVDEPRAALPAPSAATAATVVSEGLAAGAVVDQVRAVEAYAELRGFDLARQRDEVVLGAADGRVVVAFDGQGRVSSVSGRLGRVARGA